MDKPLHVTEYGGPRAGVLRVAGEIDLHSHGAWERALRGAAGRSKEVHLDLSGLNFIDVRGTALLVDVAAALPEGNRIVVQHAPAGLLRVMQVLWPDATAAIIFKGDQ